MAIHTFRAPCGFALLDALLAAAIVGVGMLAAAQFHRTMRAHADEAATRSAAVRFPPPQCAPLRPPPAPAAHTDATAALGAGAARFTLERRLGAVDGAQRPVRLTVRWADQTGTPHAVGVESALAPADAARAAAVVVVPPQGHAPMLAGRSVHLPADAQDLGDGRSAWRPDPDQPATWLLDNRNARVLARCTGPGATGCDGVPGRLVTGAIRFSAPADPAAANDAPLPTFVAIVPAAAPFPQAPACASALRERDGERALRWACVVYADGPWSGRIELVPQGWLLGISAGTRRVCRHAGDLDGSGAVDTPFEHPGTHTGVAGALTQQNFLVVPATATCPGAPAAILAPMPNGVFADLGTLPHQP